MLFIKKINIDHFNTNNVTNMSSMFCKCKSLKEININKINTINVTNMRSMFWGCPKELIAEIKIRYKNIKDDAFRKSNVCLIN